MREKERKKSNRKGGGGGAEEKTKLESAFTLKIFDKKFPRFPFKFFILF